jgi:nitroreductase
MGTIKRTTAPIVKITGPGYPLSWRQGMDFRELVLKNRSYRRFDGSVAIDRKTLTGLIGLARITPSSSNLQPLRYILSYSKMWNEKIYKTLSWAGYLKDWKGPEGQERPAAYIIVLTDKNIREAAPIDVGIAAQTILLGAAAIGLGGCMLGAIDRKALRELLELPPDRAVSLVIALGAPAEIVVLEDLGEDGSIKYHREADGTHRVPKRSLEVLIDRIYDDA